MSDLCAACYEPATGTVPSTTVLILREDPGEDRVPVCWHHGREHHRFWDSARD